MAAIKVAATATLTTFIKSIYTKTGVSNLLGVANGWASNVPNGFIATGSKNKGFVITRIVLQ